MITYRGYTLHIFADGGVHISRPDSGYICAEANEYRAKKTIDSWLDAR